MALTNKERVGRVLDLVAEGLGPWMIALLEVKYGTDWAGHVVRAAGPTNRDTTPNPSDPAYLFWIFDKQWHSLFRDHLSFEDKRAVSALWDARKEWAHGAKVASDRTERVLMDGEHLLRSIGAVEQADAVDEMRREFRRIMFEEDQKRIQRAKERSLSVQVDSTGLPAWRDVVEPHDDVARGSFQLAQFAADLRQVHQGIAGPEYGDPTEFFGRTYLTRGLRYLLEQAVQRLTGVGGEPVIDLMTTFGGGKTHSLLAVYHAASGVSADKLPGMREVLDNLGISDLPAKVNRAVLVGNDLSVLGSTKPDGTVVNTMWGELAWQLGGSEGFAMLARYDAKSAPPPTTDLEALFKKFGPCVILVDEWVAYLRQLWSRDDVAPAGTFDTHMTFVQSLTEATKAVANALLVVSLPASELVRDMHMADAPIENQHEIGGTAGLEALRHLRSVIHRLETAWQPASVEESFEIVRRRIFKPFGSMETANRDLVVGKFLNHYQKHAADLPNEVMQPGYRSAMKAAYPIHPELFDRLYQDWSTLERFQRTRGVLRLMATVVHALWTSGDKSPMILPASVPMDNQKVFEEITNHLDDTWKPIVDADIAGDGSAASTIDNEIKILGRSMATKRAARCVFLGTAPMANRRERDGSQAPVRGIEQKRVVLGCTYPGDNPSHVADALRRLGDQGKYMNRDQDRYWLSLQQTVSQIVQERADAYHEDQVFDELAAVVRRETDKGLFQRVHRFPASSIDVQDDPGIGLVIFGPDRAFSKKAKSKAEDAALEFLNKRGTNARIYKNSLVFLAPEVDRVDVMLTAVRNRMAWEYILDNKDSLNLDQHNIKLATQRVKQAEQTVADSIREAYRWILVPHQEPGKANVDLEAILMNGEGTLVERVTKKARGEEFIVERFSAALLRMQINRLDLWREKRHVPVDTMAGYFSQYVYMPKVVDPKVIIDCVWQLDEVLHIDLDGFAYADAHEGDRYVGLTLKKPAEVRPGGLIVDPTIAKAQIEADTAASATTGSTSDEAQPGEPTGATNRENPSKVGLAGKPTVTGGGGATQVTKPLTRFQATKELTSARVVRDVSQIYEEIISHFVGAGVDVKVTLDVESNQLHKLTNDQRTAIRENLKSLGFGDDDWSME
ncbi:Swt1 family HEPN domain-containing protein [Thermocatellispora tengchongensis]